MVKQPQPISSATTSSILGALYTHYATQEGSASIDFEALRASIAEDGRQLGELKDFRPALLGLVHQGFIAERAGRYSLTGAGVLEMDRIAREIAMLAEKIREREDRKRHFRHMRIGTCLAVFSVLVTCLGSPFATNLWGSMNSAAKAKQEVLKMQTELVTSAEAFMRLYWKLRLKAPPQATWAMLTERRQDLDYHSNFSQYAELSEKFKRCGGFLNSVTAQVVKSGDTQSDVALVDVERTVNSGESCDEIETTVVRYALEYQPSSKGWLIAESP